MVLLVGGEVQQDAEVHLDQAGLFPQPPEDRTQRSIRNGPAPTQTITGPLKKMVTSILAIMFPMPRQNLMI